MLKYVEARDHLGRADKIVEMGVRPSSSPK
jgi:hypothetical protein